MNIKVLQQELLNTLSKLDKDLTERKCKDWDEYNFIFGQRYAIHQTIKHIDNSLEDSKPQDNKVVSIKGLKI